MRQALALVLLTVGLALSAPAVPAVAVPDETGRYYVVGPPVNGQREYLYDIALRTLGNGNRFREITQLNIGRKQPGGGTFTDGVELRPGWILVLPRDAKGSGVRTGAPPPVVATSAPPSRSAAAPAPSSRAPRPSARATSAVARSPTAAATVGAHRTADPRRADDDQLGLILVRGGAGLLAAVFAVIAVLFLRRGGYRLRAVALDDTGPWPPERHHTPTPVEIPEIPEIPEVAEVAATAAPQVTPPPTSPGPPASPPRPLSPPSPPLPPPPSPPAPPPSPPAPPPSPPAPPPSPPAPPPSPPAPPPSPPAPPPSGPALTSVESRPATPAAGEVPYLRTDLLSDVGPVHVRLVGMASRRETPAYAWLADTEAAPPATVPLVLGSRGPWRLHVDLGQAPDVLTLVGTLDACQRLAAALARHLHSAGVGVAVIGDALGAEGPEDYRTLTGLPEPPAPGEELPEPCVIFTAGLPGGAAAGVRGLAAATGGRCVPVVVGPVPAGRWSVQVGTDG